MRRSMVRVFSGLVLTSTLLLTGCSTIQSFTEVEPEQGKDNETHIVEAPVASTESPEDLLTTGLPVGFPEVPTISEVYATQTYQTRNVQGKATWQITIASEGALDDVRAQMTSAGFSEETNLKSDIVAIFMNDRYQVSIQKLAPENNDGNAGFAYSITQVK